MWEIIEEMSAKDPGYPFRLEYNGQVDSWLPSRHAAEMTVLRTEEMASERGLSVSEFLALLEQERQGD